MVGRPHFIMPERYGGGKNRRPEPFILGTSNLFHCEFIPLLTASLLFAVLYFEVRSGTGSATSSGVFSDPVSHTPTTFNYAWRA
jgi:hypothetical protein